MFEPGVMWNIGQLIGFVLLLRYIQVQVRDNKNSLEKLMAVNYTKAETNERIDLKLRPLEVAMAHIQDDIKEIKAMLGKLLDAKNK